MIAYRVVSGVAIVSGGPIGPPGALAGLAYAFVRFAHDRRIAILGASGRCLGPAGHVRLDNLLPFNRRFLPAWQRRFVYERRRDLPRVGLAALAAEAYLLLSGRDRT